ncbi:MAG TPA: signal peptide peptidase SppA [Streptosporangiaceae bacterium]|nr:signal peptide peptidase SppA [Streptosporangiaceae bacterium]
MADARLTEQFTRLRQRATAPLILEIDLTDGLAERPVTDLLSGVIAFRKTRLSDVLDGLKKARDDDRVRAVVAKVGGAQGIGLAKAQEVRDAIASFRESGKLTVAWAETFGEFTHGNLPYYLATAFDKIYLQPSGSVGVTGIAIEQLFLHDALAKAGIDFQSAKRHEYKSAADNLTERGFTGPAREAAERLTESVTEQIAAAIADRRGKTAEQAREILQNGPFLAQQAKAEGLVDELGYRDEVYSDVRRAAGEDAFLLYIARYARLAAITQRAKRLPRTTHEDFVALINANGPIKHGRSGRGPMGDGPMGSDTVSAALRAAGEDKNAKAVLLRVNSPGGSYTASDTIWREVNRVRERGKPVIVSMGDVAASGGYFISMAADVIVALPGTLTGSIGVIFGKPVLAQLLDRAGVTTDTVGDTERARMFSATHPFTDDEWARVNGWLDAIYEDFTAKVAQGRGMTAERVHELARGRVWTGADAKEHGLVDELGGIHRAAAIARDRGGLAADAPLRPFPRISPLDQLRPPESSEARPAAAARLAWGPAWELAARAGLSPYGPLTLPGSWTIR